MQFNIFRLLDHHQHKEDWVKILDKTVLIGGILGPMMTFPQIIKIFITHQAAGVSVMTWGLYCIFNTPWIIYGIVHNQKPIVISYILWFITNLCVIAGALLYG
ncbi:MAG: hypothetical protein ABIC95_06280 [archaeon]